MTSSRILIRAATSTTVLTVLFLAVADVAFSAVNPLKKMSESGFSGLLHAYVVSKLPCFFQSKETPEVLLTGSSLFMYPAVRCDDEFQHKRTRYDADYIRHHIDGYSQAKYFENLLKRSMGRECKVANLATAGGLISDQYVIFRKCLLQGKKPRLLICDISPREFLDNHQPDPAKTPVYEASSDLASIVDLLDRQFTSQSVAENLLGCLWNYYRYRSDYRTFFVNSASRLSGHPIDLVSSTQRLNIAPEIRSLDDVKGLLFVSQKTAPQYEFRSQRDLDIKHYVSMYLPVNRKQVMKQMHYLRQLLDLAKRQGVSVMAVQMPLTRDNLALIPDGLYEDIYRQCKLVATEYGAAYYVPGKDHDYLDSEFEDTAHLNAQGGKHLFAGLAAAGTRVLSNSKLATR